MDDRRLENIIGNLLRAGVLLAAGTVFVGGVLYLAGHWGDRVSYQHFSAAGDAVQSISGATGSLNDARQCSPATIIPLSPAAATTSAAGANGRICHHPPTNFDSCSVG